MCASLSMLGMVFLFNSADVRAHESDEDDGAAEAAYCQKVMDRLDRVTDQDQLARCTDFYWHNAGYENPPGSFNNVIRIGYRIIALDPQATSTYTGIAWLLWSKWVTWKKNPENMPDGETKADESIALLMRGRKANPTNAEYHLDAAQTIEPFARHHQPARNAFVLESYALADRYAQVDSIKIRARLSTGHVLRRLGEKEKALRSYEAVLVLDPQNRVALRCIEELKKVDTLSELYRWS